MAGQTSAPDERRGVAATFFAVFAVALLLTAMSVEAASLRGSRASMDRQNRSARQHDFTFLRNAAHVRQFVRAGYLVPARGNANYELSGVSFPYTRPEVRTFIERLSRQYRDACKERLVVTSLTRPWTHQPPNASSRSVHPTGMALDLRRSRKRSCRAWLEKVLLSLERRGVLEATLEYRPPHYHIAVFPKPYARYVAALERSQSSSETYRVARGDTLWEISQRFGVSVGELKSSNSLRSNKIRPGQVLRIPAR